MPRSLFEALRHPREAPLLYACMQHPKDKDARRRYLQFLESERDVRAEALRLHDALTEPANGQALPSAASSVQRTSLRKLLALIDGVWWATISGASQVFHCGAAPKNQTPHIRFRFLCPNIWDSLEPTSDPNRRFCESCGEHVHFTDSIDRAAELARQGACISIPARLAEKTARTVTENCTGRPDWRKMWAEQIFGEESRTPSAPEEVVGIDDVELLEDE